MTLEERYSRITFYNKDRDPRDLEPSFSQHMLAMTAEDLHDKGDIAKELAVRDLRINSLIAELNRLCDVAEQVVVNPGWRAPLGALDNAVDFCNKADWRYK